MEANKPYVDRQGILHLGKVQARRELTVLPGEKHSPKITIEGLDEVIIADIKKHRLNVHLAEKDHAAFSVSISTLAKRRLHYNNLIKKMKSGEEKRYSLDRMEEVVKEMEVEQRKLEDAKKYAIDRRTHFAFVLNELETQLAEDYGKAVTANGTVINVS